MMFYVVTSFMWLRVSSNEIGYTDPVTTEFDCRSYHRRANTVVYGFQYEDTALVM